MNLPDSFPKQFKLTLAIDMQMLMDASITGWGRVLQADLQRAEITAAEQIRNFRSRYTFFKYYGWDIGEEPFEFDYNYAWVTTDDGTIQLLRLDMIPLSDRALNAEIDFIDGKLEEYQEEDGTWTFRKVKNNESPSV